MFYRIWSKSREISYFMDQNASFWGIRHVTHPHAVSDGFCPMGHGAAGSIAFRVEACAISRILFKAKSGQQGEAWKRATWSVSSSQS